MSDDEHSRGQAGRDRVTACRVWLLGAAWVWSLALLIVGATGLETSNRALLTAALAVPVLTTALVSYLLRRRRSAGGGSATWATRTAIAVLALFALVAGFSIGVFVVPVVGLLLAASIATPDAGDRDNRSPGRAV